MIAGPDRIEAAIRRAASAGRPALAAFLTAGFPSLRSFPAFLRATACAADVIEIGVPFSDPMADGVTIQRTSRIALEEGTTLAWILATLSAETAGFRAPCALMSYVNPLLAYGAERLAADAAEAGVAAFIVPDLPLEEQDLLAPSLRARGIGLVQLATPATPPARLHDLCAASDGFVYAVAVNGTTGGRAGAGEHVREYLSRVRAASRRPVLAGFGIRTRHDVQALVPPADGVIVGSALLESIERGEDPEWFLRSLREAPVARMEARP
jgi:tryptophan synthase alpha chain